MEFSMQANQPFLIVITTLFIIMAMLMFAIFRDPTNTLSCWQFISSRNADGKDMADIDKLGKVMCLFVLVGIVINQEYHSRLADTTLLIFVTFAGGVAGYSAYLRAKTGATGQAENK